MENFGQIQDVGGDYARSTRVDAMFNGYPDTLTKRRKHFVEYDLLIEVRSVSLPLLPSRLLENNNHRDNYSVYSKRESYINITVRFNMSD